MMRRVVRALGGLLAASLSLAILAGHAGYLHAALDSFAHLRVQLLLAAAVACIVLLAARMRSAALVLGAVTIGSAALTVPWYAEDAGALPDGTVVTVLQQNVLYENPSIEFLVDRVRSLAPDVVALQEVSEAAAVAIEALEEGYPHVHRCSGGGFVGDVVLLSRTPFSGTRRCAPGLAVGTVRIGDALLSVGSLHLRWPWPFGQWEHIDTVRPVLRTIAEPGILVGDFNAVPWSRSVSRIAETFDAGIRRGVGGTRIDPNLPLAVQPLWDLPIDQVLTTKGVAVLATDAVPLLGSDHDTVVTRFVIARGAPELIVSADEANLVVHDPLRAHFAGGLDDGRETDAESEDDGDGADGTDANHDGSPSHASALASGR